MALFFFTFGWIKPLEAQSLNIPLITVEGTAIIYQAPDEVHYNFTVESEAKQIDTARKQNEIIVKEAIAYLMAKGVEKKYIQTQYMSVGRNYQRNRKVYDGFIAKQTIFVCLRQLSNYDEISDGLLQKNIASLSGPTFKSSQISKLKDKARIKAMENAKSKAQLLAESLNQKVGKAKLISEVWFRSNRNSGAYASGNEVSSQIDFDELGFAPGQLEIKAVVNVSFELLE